MAKIKFVGKDGEKRPYPFPKFGVVLTPGNEYELPGKIAAPLVNSGLAVRVSEQRAEHEEPKVEAAKEETSEETPSIFRRSRTRKPKKEEIGKPLDTEGTEE